MQGVRQARLQRDSSISEALTMSLLCIDDHNRLKPDNPLVEEIDTVSMIHGDPTTFQEAMSGSQANQWYHAIKEEWNSILHNQTFELPGENIALKTIPSDAKPISSKWVFKTKTNPDGSTRYKACLVIRGYQQVEGVDYGETYAPVSKLATFRLLIYLSAYYGWHIDHMDVVTAFLNPTIDRENIYMRLPPCIEEIDSRVNGSTIVRLLKALYGLKQAPRLWFEEIHAFLLSIGATQSTTDPNLYMRGGSLILLYVDDTLIIHVVPEAGNEIKHLLQAKYKMSDLGIARRFLGIQIEQAATGITLSQADYLKKILNRFGMEKAHGSASPMDVNVRLDNPTCEDRQVTDVKGYLAIVGSLMYAALGTRPDIAFCVTALSRYNSAPLTMHLTAAKRALRYLKETLDLKLTFPRACPITGGQTSAIPTAKLTGFTDSDWGSHIVDRKSVGGCIFFGGSFGIDPDLPRPAAGPVHWQSKSQTVVALSTLEAEYIACSDATRKAIWLRRIYQDILDAAAILKGENVVTTPVPLGCDNQGALKLIETGVSKQKTKHIDIKFHHARDEAGKGTVIFHYVASSKNPADLLTKALPIPKHRELTRMSGLL